MQVTLRDAGDLRAAVRDLRKALNGKQLRKELSRGIRDELKFLVPKLRAAYRSAPSRTGGRGRLRRALARAVKVEVKLSGRQAGARVRVDGRKMPDGQGSLPAMWEDYARWRHPVWGDRDVWVTQEPHPVFDRTVRPYRGRVRRRIEQIAEEILRRIVRG